MILSTASAAALRRFLAVVKACVRSLTSSSSFITMAACFTSSESARRTRQVKGQCVHTSDDHFAKGKKSCAKVASSCLLSYKNEFDVSPFFILLPSVLKTHVIFLGWVTMFCVLCPL